VPKPPLPPPRRGFEHIFRFVASDGEVLAKIMPGEFYVTAPPESVTTLLGSCIAACIRDPALGLGGMNHFMLPRLESWREAASEANRYGTAAMENLINELLKAGGRRDRLEVKIFGGGNMGLAKSAIGKQNISFVEEFLAREGLPIAARCVGGSTARRVVYEPGSGRVRLLKLPPLEQRAVAVREAELARTIATAPAEAGSIELFD
jgi:chemotaxis protein CheD